MLIYPAAVPSWLRAASGLGDVVSIGQSIYPYQEKFRAKISFIPYDPLKLRLYGLEKAKYKIPGVRQ